MKLLNEDQIKIIFEIDSTGELFSRLLDIFEQDIPTYILDLESALKSNQLDNAKKISHSIKSSSLNIGAAELANRAHEFETAGSINPQTFEQLIEFRDCFKYSVKELRECFNSYKS